jgi:hypothetical protein
MKTLQIAGFSRSAAAYPRANYALAARTAPRQRESGGDAPALLRHDMV